MGNNTEYLSNPPNTYIDPDNGYMLHVRFNNGSWKTYGSKPNQSTLKEYQEIPAKDTFTHAQRALDQYAQLRQIKPVHNPIPPRQTMMRNYAHD